MVIIPVWLHRQAIIHTSSNVIMFAQMIKLNCYSDKSTTFYNTQAITDCKSLSNNVLPSPSPAVCSQTISASLKIRLESGKFNTWSQKGKNYWITKWPQMLAKVVVVYSLYILSKLSTLLIKKKVKCAYAGIFSIQTNALLSLSFFTEQSSVHLSET